MPPARPAPCKMTFYTNALYHRRAHQVRRGGEAPPPVIPAAAGIQSPGCAPARLWQRRRAGWRQPGAPHVFGPRMKRPSPVILAAAGIQSPFGHRTWYGKQDAARLHPGNPDACPPPQPCWRIVRALDSRGGENNRGRGSGFPPPRERRGLSASSALKHPPCDTLTKP